MSGNQRASSLFVRSAVFGAALLFSACNRRREPPVTQVAPHVEAGAPSASAPVVDATSAAIEIANVQTFVTTTGPPGHVRLSVENHSAIASTVSIVGVEWVDGSARRPLTVNDVDLPGRRPDGGRSFVVSAGGKVSVTVLLSSDALEPNATAYAFVLRAAVDGVVRDVEVSVQRARREPWR